MTFYWELPSSQLPILTAMLLPGAFAASAIAPLASRRLGKPKAFIVLLALSVTITASPVILRLLGFFPGNASGAVLPILAIVTLATATCGTACMILTGAMLADITEEAELRTGRRSEGLIFASLSFVFKAVSGAGIFLASIVLSIADLNRSAVPGTVPQSTLQTLAITYLVILVSCYAIGLWIMSRYRADRDSHANNVAALAIRKANAD